MKAYFRRRKDLWLILNAHFSQVWSTGRSVMLFFFFCLSDITLRFTFFLYDCELAIVYEMVITLNINVEDLPCARIEPSPFASSVPTLYQMVAPGVEKSLLDNPFNIWPCRSQWLFQFPRTRRHPQVSCKTKHWMFSAAPTNGIWVKIGQTVLGQPMDWLKWARSTWRRYSTSLRNVPMRWVSKSIVFKK